jgi:hypothetical protein
MGLALEFNIIMEKIYFEAELNENFVTRKKAASAYVWIVCIL